MCSRILLVVISNNKNFCVFDVFFWYHMSILLFIRDSNVLGHCCLVGIFDELISKKKSLSIEIPTKKQCQSTLESRLNGLQYDDSREMVSSLVNQIVKSKILM